MPGIAFKGSGAEVRVSSSSVGRPHADQTFPSARRARAGSEGIKIKRLQQQHSFPGQMAVSLDFDDLSAPPQNQEPAEAAAVPQQSAFVGGLLGRSSVAQSPARQAWQPSAETERDPWASHGGPLTRHATAATEPTHGGQQPAPQPEPEVVPWAVTRTKITSSPAKHSVQIRIPNDRTAYVEPASDENAFAGRRGTDGGVPRSKLAMAEVRQRRVREKQKKLAEQGKQSKLRELEEGIRSRRAAAAAAAAAAEVAAAEEAAQREMATATAAVAGEALRRPAARSPARSNRRGQPKSPSRASANQKAATKRLSQPVPRPPAANVPDPMNTAAAQNHSTLGESVPRQRAVPSARRPAKSTVDWDSLLVQSDVDILDAAIDNSTGKHQSAGSTRTTHNMASDTVQSPESKRAAKARGSKPARDRRQTLDAAASPGGKQRADTPSVKTEGAVGQLKNTWQQLQHEPRGKRSSSASASTAPTFAARLGKPGRVLTSSKSTVSATKRNVRAAAASRSGSATQKAKQKRRASEVASTAQKNDSKHSLDLLLTDETAGSRSSSPLFRQQTQNTAPSPLNLGTYQVDKIESMLQELKSLLADHMQEEVLRAQEESEILELRKAAAHDRADAHLKRVLAHGDGGDENQEAHTMIAMRLADELAEIGKSTAHHRVASVRQKLNLQHWEERILKLCDEVDACRRGVRDVHANETTVRELMSAMKSGNDQRVALMDRLRRQFEDESQQLNRQQGSFNTLQQQHDPTTDAAAQEPRQLEPSARMNGVDIGEGGQTTNGAEHTVDESDSVDENSAEELMGDSLVEDVQALAEFLGIDPTSEPHLMWIARQCLDAQLPPAWSEYFEEATGNAYYYNELTKITTWDHPLDSHFKALVQEERLAHAARKVLSSTDYSTAARHVADSRRGAQAVVQSDAHVDVNNTQADANDHDGAIGQNGLSSKAAPPRARMVQSLNGKPLDLSDLNVSVSTTPAKDSPDRTKNAKMLSPKSLAAQIITLSSDSDTDQEQHAGLTGACMLGKLIPASTHPVVMSSPGYSDQSSLDVDALEKSLLEHHRSTSPSPHQGQSVMQHQTTAQNDEIMSDISAHSENSGDEDVLYPQSPHELALMAAKLDDDLDTSLSQTELDVIVQQLHRIEDEEDDAMCEQDRDSKAMAALRSIARRTDIPPPVASPGPSYVEPVLSPSRNKGISRDASEAGLSALRKMIKEALACTDIKTVQLMIQEVVTRGKQLRGEEQEALEPDMAKLIAAAHRMERTAVTSSEPDSDNGDEQYTDDDFEDEDEANAQVGTSAGSPTVAQKPPSSPVTPTIDPVQTSSPTKKELMAGIGEADNAFAYANAIQSDIAEDLATNSHELNSNVALSASALHGEHINSLDYASYQIDLAQSLSDSGVWSDELSLAGPVDCSDQNAIRYIGNLFEFARRQLGKPEPETSPVMRHTAESESAIALSLVLEKTHEPNHQLFVAFERERERQSVEDGATAVVTEAQQIYNMALFDACAEAVSAELSAASVMHHKRHWLSGVQHEAPQNTFAGCCLTQEMITQRVLSNTKWQLRNEDVQQPGLRATADRGSHRVLGVHAGPWCLGRGHHKCVVDSIVRDQFVAESRLWFDRAEEEEELQQYIADQILDMLVGETVGVLNVLQEKNTQRAAAAEVT